MSKTDLDLERSRELTVVSQYARMNKLAHIAFGREVLRKVNDIILPLNDSGAGLAFYCVHSITGSATDFRFLARMLGPEQKFFGIQVPTEKRNAEFASSIESLSRYYVDALVQFQTHGPFVLGGHSVGATIALEMAHQLRARGREVALLVVFDGELFNTGTEISTHHPLYWLKLICNVPAWVRDFLLVEFTFRTFCKRIANKATATFKTIAGQLRGSGISTGHAVEGFINLDRCTPAHAAFMKVLFETQFTYVPKQYSGRVLVYVAKTQALTHLRQVKTAWRKVAQASDIIQFKGTHTSLIRAPQGLALAQNLARRIAEIESGCAALQQKTISPVWHHSTESTREGALNISDDENVKTSIFATT
jgi:thioesterase domain-containing protein